MFFLRFLLLALLLPARGRGSDLLAAVPAASRQMVVVMTDDWTHSAAMLRRFTRAAAGAPWMPVGAPIRALTGANGLAWGRGLHGPRPPGSRQKREGDRCAPAGVFRLPGAFGQLSPRELEPLRLPYQQVSRGWEAIDDPASRFYNRIVNRAAITRPDWRSSESLSGGAHYRLAVLVAHNEDAVPGAGSCIFLHEWTGRQTGTAGCTVLRRDDLRTLVRWLDARAHPVLLQAPRTEAPGW